MELDKEQELKWEELDELKIKRKKKKKTTYGKTRVEGTKIVDMLKKRREGKLKRENYRAWYAHTKRMEIRLVGVVGRGRCKGRCIQLVFG